MESKVNDALKYYAHLWKYVKVNTHSTTDFDGWLKDIDPLSGNLLLVNFEDHDSKNKSVVLVPGHDIESVVVMKEDENMKNSIQHFFKKETEASPTELLKRKKRIISWLEKNRIQVRESDGNIIVYDAATIYPPYTIEDCLSDNGRVAWMTRKLISSMPETSEEDMDSD